MGLQFGWKDAVEEEARSPLARLRGERNAMVGDGEALMTDGVCMSPWGDGAAHLDQKEGCGSLPEASRSRLRMPSGDHAAQAGDVAAHAPGVASGEAGTHPWQTSRGRVSGASCEDGDVY